MSGDPDNSKPVYSFDKEVMAAIKSGESSHCPKDEKRPWIKVVCEERIIYMKKSFLYCDKHYDESLFDRARCTGIVSKASGNNGDCDKRAKEKERENKKIEEYRSVCRHYRTNYYTGRVENLLYRHLKVGFNSAHPSFFPNHYKQEKKKEGAKKSN